MDTLRDALLGDADLTRLMQQHRYTGIGLIETDGGSDMLLRLNAREFDVAFVPSRIWLDQTAGYSVILQTRRQRDITSTRGRTVLQAGVVFISPRSPYFSTSTLAAEDFSEYLAGERIAVEYSQSLAGFIAPMSKLAEDYQLAVSSQDFLWCRSSAEVTKAVLSGLADVGVCEEGGLEETLAASGLLARKAELVRVVVRSRPVPTDPVVVRSDLAPSRSLLGQELKRALRAHSLNNGFGTITLQNAQDSDYIEVQALLDQFERRFSENRP